MKKKKWFTMEIKKFHDYPRNSRFIVKTYKVFGLTLYKHYVRWD